MDSVNNKMCKSHSGNLIESVNGFDVIECADCGFKHVVPMPTEVELEEIYRHDYYTEEKPLYIERYIEDGVWWDAVYSQRYDLLEKFLPQDQRHILDIGSGPGLFLAKGRERGWIVRGVEPSKSAAEHARKNLQLDISNVFYNKETCKKIGKFDAINLGEVLEHIPKPVDLLKLIHEQLNDNGLVSIIVPNDFNPFQKILRNSLNFQSWWVAPPHHLNYFSPISLARLMEKCSFEVVSQETTFPIDMFLLMGKNYIQNDVVGREVHSLRKTFEMNILSAGEEGKSLLQNIYKSFSQCGIGREIFLIARKV